MHMCYVNYPHRWNSKYAGGNTRGMLQDVQANRGALTAAVHNLSSRNTNKMHRNMGLLSTNSHAPSNVSVAHTHAS